MARQRMYVYERAYVDYASGLKRFVQLIWRACTDVWNWFWQGTGAKVIEVLLQIAIVAAASFAGYLYIQYERAHDHPFSFSTFFNLVVLALFVMMILWGWKALVHLVARIVSGGIALLILAAIGLVTTAIAIIVFIPYLLFLFTLTALSFIVFLPMRAIHGLWLLRRQITYRCPYDDCSYSGMPIHVCSCGQHYSDLQPSFYGIFHHTCQKPNHKQKLPTLDIFGRNKLDRLCGKCGRPLIFSDLGELAEKPIAIVGGENTGKTIFLRQVTRQIVQTLGSKHGSKVHVASPIQERALQSDLALLDQGRVVAKTSGDVLQAFGIAARLSKEQRYLLYMFDAPGEIFQRMEQMGRKQSFQHLAGIILFVDPFTLPELRDHSLHQTDALKPSGTAFQQVVNVLVNGINLMLVKHPTDVCRVPVAVVIGKADALPSKDFPFLADLLPHSGNGHDDSFNQRCRQALEKLGARASVNILEQKFSNVRYFACSALGRMPALGDSRPFQPVGVIEPVHWLLLQWGKAHK